MQFKNTFYDAGELIEPKRYIEYKKDLKRVATLHKYDMHFRSSESFTFNLACGGPGSLGFSFVAEARINAQTAKYTKSRML